MNAFDDNKNKADLNIRNNGIIEVGEFEFGSMGSEPANSTYAYRIKNPQGLAILKFPEIPESKQVRVSMAYETSIYNETSQHIKICLISMVYQGGKDLYYYDISAGGSISVSLSYIYEDYTYPALLFWG